jgi:hypothetical protein
MAQGRQKKTDRLELVSVRLGSGKVYLVPRALLEGLVRAYPFESLALIQEAGVERNLLTTLGAGRGTSTTGKKRTFPVRIEQEGHQPLG